MLVQFVVEHRIEEILRDLANFLVMSYSPFELIWLETGSILKYLPTGENGAI